MIEKTVFFDYLVKSEVKAEYGCPPIEILIDSFNERFTSCETSSLDQIIFDVASDNISIYTEDLISNCSTLPMHHYLNETIKELSGEINDIETLYRTTEFNYYYSILNDNIDVLIKNNLIDFVKSKLIKIKESEDEISNKIKVIKTRVGEIIENYKVDTLLSPDFVIDSFENYLYCEIDKLAENIIENKLVEDGDSESNNVSNQILYFQVGKAPVVLELEEDSLTQLQQLVGGYIETINILSQDSNPVVGVDIILNEEGKLFDLPINKPLRYNYIYENSEDNEIFDYIFGDFVVVGVDFTEGEFIGLTPTNLAFWKNEFENAELVSLGKSYLASKNSCDFKLNDQNELIEISL